MIDFNSIKTPKDQSKHLEILSNLPTLNEALMDDEMKIEDVRVLLKIEADTKARLTTLQRLVARYNVLEGRANEAEMMKYVASRSK